MGDSPTRSASRTNADRFFPKTRSTLRLDGAGRPRRPPRRHPLHLPRMDGSLRPRALGLRPDRALHRLRPRLRQSFRRHRIVRTPAAGVLLSARRHFQNLRNRNPGLGARGLVAEQLVLGAHLHSGFSSGAAGFRRSRGQVGGLGMGVFSLRRLLRRGLGVVHVPGHARTLLAVSVGLASGKFLAHARLDSLRPALRLGRADRTGRAGGLPAAWHLDALPPLSAGAPLESRR